MTRRTMMDQKLDESAKHWRLNFFMYVHSKGVDYWDRP